MEQMERKNKGDVLTLDDVHPEIRFGIIAHRRRRRAELLVKSAMNPEWNRQLGVKQDGPVDRMASGSFASAPPRLDLAEQEHARTR